MYESNTTILDDGRVQLIRILCESIDLKYSEVIRLWQSDKEFVRFFINVLGNCPYEAFRWETPPVKIGTENQDFQFVILDSPGLGGRIPDTHSFAKQLSSCNGDNSVATFDNLGGDATLVVPAKLIDESAYVEIASFTRNAPESQQLELWRSVGVAMNRRIGQKPVWLSTAGGGVSWLHVRIDSRPKYYGYAPFKNAT